MNLQENENFIQNKFGYCFYSLGPCPIIYNLYVHPKYRKNGHSKRLLSLVISEIKRTGYSGDIYIQATPKEGSIGLSDLTEYYKKMGLAIYEAHKPDSKNQISRIEIDCRECSNCDFLHDCCKKYKGNPEKAVSACAADGFKHFMKERKP